MIDTEKFIKRIDKTNTCWNWAGAITTSHGYGTFGWPRKYAHRVSYEIFKGDIPSDLTIDHLCRNRRCVNPEHLEAVSCIENVMRGNSIPAKNSRKTHCKRGHEFTALNTSFRKTKRGSFIGRWCKACDRIRANIYYRRKCNA